MKVRSNDGVERTARFFFLCTGFAAKPYVLDFKGSDRFAGVHCHTSKWPQGGIDCRGKHVEVVGNGSSSLQGIAPEVPRLTVFQRSPTYALPMRQGLLGVQDQNKATCI